MKVAITNATLLKEEIVTLGIKLHPCIYVHDCLLCLFYAGKECYRIKGMAITDETLVKEVITA